MLAVTLHDPLLALNYCDRLLLLFEGCILGILCPKTDSLEQMEVWLNQIYDRISLMRLTGPDGREHLVLPCGNNGEVGARCLRHLCGCKAAA